MDYDIIPYYYPIQDNNVPCWDVIILYTNMHSFLTYITHTTAIQTILANLTLSYGCKACALFEC